MRWRAKTDSQHLGLLNRVLTAASPGREHGGRAGTSKCILTVTVLVTPRRGDTQVVATAARHASPATGPLPEPIGHDQPEGPETLGEQELTRGTPLVSEVSTAAVVSMSRESSQSGFPSRRRFLPCRRAEIPGRRLHSRAPKLTRAQTAGGPWQRSLNVPAKPCWPGRQKTWLESLFGVSPSGSKSQFGWLIRCCRGRHFV